MRSFLKIRDDAQVTDKARTPSVPADLSTERLIDRAEFQALLGIGQATFERLKARGALPNHIALSRTCHRWRLPTVLAFLREREGEQ